MTMGDAIAAASLGTGIVGAMLGCTWHLSSKLTQLSGRISNNDTKIAAVDRRADELFRWVSALAKHMIASGDRSLSYLASPPSPTTGDDT